ncbi:hypothetical protein [Methylorubrum zatmanii]
MICLGFLFVFTCEPATTPPPPAAPYCDIARPIDWSAQDTRETKEAADRENRKWKRLCGTKASGR